MGKEKENGKCKEEKLQNEERTLFMFFIVCLFLFFELNQNGNFLPGKSISLWEEIKKNWLCSLRNIFLLRPWHRYMCLQTCVSSLLCYFCHLSPITISFAQKTHNFVKIIFQKNANYACSTCRFLASSLQLTLTKVRYHA